MQHPFARVRKDYEVHRRCLRYDIDVVYWCKHDEAPDHSHERYEAKWLNGVLAMKRKMHAASREKVVNIYTLLYITIFDLLED